MFAINDVSSWVAERPETVGSKEKRWLIPSPNSVTRPHLFKIGRDGTGEHWAEKVTAEIAKLLELPAATYEFATHDGQLGVLSEKFLPSGAAFHPANQIIARIDRGYDGSKRFKQVRYRLLPSLGIIKLLKFRFPLEPVSQLPEMPAEELFVGYLMFDALTGNTDRHHENWGVVLTSGGDAHLAPTFDHASSLGRELTDDRRKERLTTKDARASVEAYASRARAAFYGPGRAERPLTNAEVVSLLKASQSKSTKFWAGKIANLSSDDLREIVQKVPPSLISDPAAEFALRVLSYNQRAIREIVDA